MFVTRKWAPAVGGMETYSMRLTEALNEIEPVEVVALRGKADGMPPGLMGLLAFPFRVASRFFARKTAPAVLHVGDMALWPIGLLGKMSPHTKIAISAHGTDVAYHRRGGVKGTLYGAYLHLGAKLLRKSTIIANSRATCEVLCETGWVRSMVIPLATELSGPAPDGNHNGRILFVGRLVKRKGFSWFVREVLPLLDPAIKLDVAGTGWDYEEWAALEDPRVNFLGSLHGDELITAYRNAMCVIVPNISVDDGEYEGFGLVAPEAASCGACVLAADRDGLRDAVIDGETAQLVRSGDPIAWASAIAKIHSTDHETSRQKRLASVATSRKIFNWTRVANDTLAAYELDR